VCPRIEFTTEMGVSDEAKNVIPLKFLRKIKNIFFSSCKRNPGTYCIIPGDQEGLFKLAVQLRKFFNSVIHNWICFVGLFDKYLIYKAFTIFLGPSWL
jgi:hypothetical protein